MLISPVIGGTATFVPFGTNIRVGPSERKLLTLESVPSEHWATLAEKRIFFGHQSVGYNIVDGIKDVMREHENIRMNIVETPDPARTDQPLFGHCKVGKNRDPLSKTEAFKDIVNRNADAGIDIALMKFCYVDVTRDSDVESILKNYIEVIDQLKEQHPTIVFLHATIPLRSGYAGPGWQVEQLVKRMTGRPTLVDDNNKRHSYNELLRERYAGDSIYDIELVESMTTQAQACHVKKSQGKVPFLWMGYSADGGHLNTLGRRRAAEQLLITLARAANE